MKDKIYIEKEDIVNHVYDNINETRDVTASKALIESVVQSQSNFTTDKIHEGTFEAINWKGMGKFIPNFNTLRKILKAKNKND